MNDLISRKAALDIQIPYALNDDGILYIPYTCVMEHLENLPPVSQWIPCSEQLPETEEKVLCCTVTKKGAHNLVIGYHLPDRWVCGMNSNVIAWMPLPAPYRKEGNL